MDDAATTRRQRHPRPLRLARAGLALVELLPLPSPTRCYACKAAGVADSATDLQAEVTYPRTQTRRGHSRARDADFIALCRACLVGPPMPPSLRERAQRLLAAFDAPSSPPELQEPSMQTTPENAPDARGIANRERAQADLAAARRVDPDGRGCPMVRRRRGQDAPARCGGKILKKHGVCSPCTTWLKKHGRQFIEIAHIDEADGAEVANATEVVTEAPAEAAETPDAPPTTIAYATHRAAIDTAASQLQQLRDEKVALAEHVHRLEQDLAAAREERDHWKAHVEAVDVFCDALDVPSVDDDQRIPTEKRVEQLVDSLHHQLDAVRTELLSVPLLDDPPEDPHDHLVKVLDALRAARVDPAVVEVLEEEIARTREALGGVELPDAVAPERLDEHARQVLEEMQRGLAAPAAVAQLKEATQHAADFEAERDQARLQVRTLQGQLEELAAIESALREALYRDEPPPVDGLRGAWGSLAGAVGELARQRDDEQSLANGTAEDANARLDDLERIQVALDAADLDDLADVVTAREAERVTALAALARGASAAGGDVPDTPNAIAVHVETRFADLARDCEGFKRHADAAQENVDITQGMLKRIRAALSGRGVDDEEVVQLVCDADALWQRAAGLARTVKGLESQVEQVAEREAGQLTRIQGLTRDRDQAVDALSRICDLLEGQLGVDLTGEPADVALTLTEKAVAALGATAPAPNLQARIDNVRAELAGWAAELVQAEDWRPLMKVSSVLDELTEAAA